MSNLGKDALLFELGSYWEGALYYLCVVMGYGRRPLVGILEAERAAPQGHPDLRQALFLAIWNSHGQLKWLKAHLIREQAVGNGEIPSGDISEITEIMCASGQNTSPDLAWLAAFVAQHRQEGGTYPNPLFGGTNPLHLGLFPVP